MRRGPAIRRWLAATAIAIGLWTLPAAAQVRPSYVPVERVVDGDTVVLKGIGRVRLIGVDTPESVHPQKPVERFAREASAFLHRLLDGRSVRLEYDQTPRDRYRRTLAYLFLPDGTFVNEEIIRRGYGFAYTRYPFRYLERFRAVEREARARKVGLWGP